MQKYGSRRHLTKHNHDKRFTWCPPNNALQQLLANTYY